MSPPFDRPYYITPGPLSKHPDEVSGGRDESPAGCRGPRGPRTGPFLPELRGLAASSAPDRLFDERLAQRTERSASMTRREAQQPQEDLSGDERVAAGGVAVVRHDPEEIAQRVERKAADRCASGERPGLLQV